MVSAGKHSTAAIGGKFTIPPPVIRTMYKNLLRIARQLDTHPIVKVHTPIHNAILRRALGIAKGTSLYIPNSSKYEQCVQAEFRRRRERTAKDMNAAFEAIQLFQKSLDILLKGNTTLLGSAAGALSHPPIPIPNAHRATSSGTLTPPSKCQGGLPSVSSPSTSSVGVPSSPASWVVYQTKPKLAPGTLLISHPLTKAHMDRRVVLLVDVDAHDNLVGLVLDLWYNGSVTKGNTMIPEPLWSHNVQYGGPFHVLLTMPPTAAMSALHCGVLNGMPEEGSTPSPTTLPSEDQQTVPSEEDFRWLFAGKPQSTPAQGPKDSAHLAAHNNIPHRLVIPGTLPLYYTRVEHLSELSEECLGKDRSQVRLFWGFVAWSRANLAQEIAEGVWFPCSVSSDFLVRSALSEQNLETEDSNATATTTTRTRTDSHSSTNESFLHSQAARETIASHERFPTRQELEHDRGLRKRFTGSTAVPPHLANASLGSVRRDTLWDEIMLALGGEFSRSVEPPRVEDNTVSSSKCTPLSRDDEAAHLFSGEEEEDDEQS